MLYFLLACRLHQSTKDSPPEQESTPSQESTPTDSMQESLPKESMVDSATDSAIDTALPLCESPYPEVIKVCGQHTQSVIGNHLLAGDIDNDGKDELISGGNKRLNIITEVPLESRYLQESEVFRYHAPHGTAAGATILLANLDGDEQTDLVLSNPEFSMYSSICMYANPGLNFSMENNCIHKTYLLGSAVLTVPREEHDGLFTDDETGVDTKQVLYFQDPLEAHYVEQADLTIIGVSASFCCAMYAIDLEADGLMEMALKNDHALYWIDPADRGMVDIDSYSAYGAQVLSVAIADINEDGYSDILYESFLRDLYTVYGPFSSNQPPTSMYLASIPGAPSVLSSQDGPRLVLRYQDNLQVFPPGFDPIPDPATAQSFPGLSVDSVIMHDFDHDGNEELIAGDPGDSTMAINAGAIYIFSNL